MHVTTDLMHYFPDGEGSIFSTTPFFVDPVDLPVRSGKQEELKDIQANEAATSEMLPIHFERGVAETKFSPSRC